MWVHSSAAVADVFATLTGSDGPAVVDPVGVDDEHPASAKMAVTTTALSLAFIDVPFGKGDRESSALACVCGG